MSCSVLVGLGLITLGWVFVRHDYASSLAQSLGVAALLVAPIVWVERLLEKRVAAGEEVTRLQVGDVAAEVEAVAERLEATKRTVEDLQSELADGLRAAADADSALVAAAREDFSFDRVAALFDRALELDAITDRGLRVPVPGQWERFRFHPQTLERRGAASDQVRSIVLSVEGSNGTPENLTASWDEGTSVSDAFLVLAEQWKRATTYPGDQAMKLDWVIDRLLLSFEVAIGGRRTRGDENLDRLLELVSPNWALTEYGLERLPTYYPIKRDDLIDEEKLDRLRVHMTQKRSIAREDDQRDALDPDFWMIAQVAHGYFVRELEDED